MTEPPRATESSSAQRVLWSTWLVFAGGLLLGVQRQVTGEWVGTGYVALGVGAVVALFGLVFSLAGGWSELRVPRDGLSLLSAAAGFAGIAFLTSAALVPGGNWMFAEAAFLVLLLAKRDTRAAPVGEGPTLRMGAILVFAAFLLFRLWLTYQGSQHRWAAISIDLPLVPFLPLDLPSSWTTIELGQFSAAEFGFPRVGLDFSSTVLAWGAGFALCAAGLWLRQRAALEYEDDRIQATIEELPPALADLVQRVLPEEEWMTLGLHGLSDRRRRKRISQLTEARITRAVDLHRNYLTCAWSGALLASEFERSIADSVQRYRLLAEPRDAGTQEPA